MSTKIAVVSRCLLSVKCRYDAEVRVYDIKERLLSQGLRIIDVCPEVEIGLNVPREPIRLIDRGGRILVIQQKTERRLKRRLEMFSRRFIQSLDRVDLLVLKSRSPSCGNNDCKVFDSLYGENIVGYADGIFTSICKTLLPDVKIYNEENLDL